jgi:hypothetical protein
MIAGFGRKMTARALCSQGDDMARFGASAVELVVLLIGVFLSIAAYSRQPVLLRVATLGTLRIHPDSPGTAARRTLFICGVVLIVVAAVLLFSERLRDLGLM